MKPRIGIALFGACRSALSALQKLSQAGEVSVKYIVDRDGGMAAKRIAGMQFPEKPRLISPTYQQLAYRDSSVDAVVLCSPDVTVNVARRIISHKKSVFVGVPFYRDVDSLLACYEEADVAKSVLFSFFSRRFNPSLQTLRQRISNGDLGKIQTIKASATYSHMMTTSGQISGNLFHECAVNDLDLVCWLTNQNPENIYVQASANSPEVKVQGGVDTAAMVIRFSDGIIATIDVTRNTLSEDHKIEIHGSKGVISLDNNHPYGTMISCIFEKGAKKEVVRASYTQQHIDEWTRAFQHFGKVVKGEEAPAVSMTDTVRAATMASACEESNRNGTMVRLALDNTLDMDKVWSQRPAWQNRPDVYW